MDLQDVVSIYSCVEVCVSCFSKTPYAGDCLIGHKCVKVLEAEWGKFSGYWEGSFCWALAASSANNVLKELGEAAFAQTGLLYCQVPDSLKAIPCLCFVRCPFI